MREHALGVEPGELSAADSPADAARYFGVPVSDPRHPDVWGVVQVGCRVYRRHQGHRARRRQHPTDRDVPIVVYAPGVVEPGTYHPWVETTRLRPRSSTCSGWTSRRSRRFRSKPHGCCPASHTTDPAAREPRASPTRDARGSREGTRAPRASFTVARVTRAPALRSGACTWYAYPSCAPARSAPAICPAICSEASVTCRAANSLTAPCSSGATRRAASASARPAAS
jgi:hypothetical protein